MLAELEPGPPWLYGLQQEVLGAHGVVPGGRWSRGYKEDMRSVGPSCVVP